MYVQAPLVAHVATPAADVPTAPEAAADGAPEPATGATTEPDATGDAQSAAAVTVIPNASKVSCPPRCLVLVAPPAARHQLYNWPRSFTCPPFLQALADRAPSPPPSPAYRPPSRTTLRPPPPPELQAALRNLSTAQPVDPIANMVSATGRQRQQQKQPRGSSWAVRLASSSRCPPPLTPHHAPSLSGCAWFMPCVSLPQLCGQPVCSPADSLCRT